MKKSSNNIHLYISLALAQIFALFLVVDYQIHYLHEIQRLAINCCAITISFTTLIFIHKADNESCYVLKMFTFSCLSTFIITIICLLEPDVYFILSCMFWAIILLNGIIMVVLSVRKYNVIIENKMHETDIFYPYHYTISCDYYGWVALSLILFYITFANHLFDFISERLVGMLETFCILTPTIYFMNLQWNKKNLGIDEKVVKGKKYVSKKILPWMTMINILLFIAGYSLIFINPQNEFIRLFYMATFTINTIFIILIIIGIFKNKDPLKENS